MTPLSEMPPTEKNIAIAERNGWLEIETNTKGDSYGYLPGTTVGKFDKDSLPDYTGASRDPIMDAILDMNEDDYDLFIRYLFDMVSDALRATPTQLCDAYLLAHGFTP